MREAVWAQLLQTYGENNKTLEFRISTHIYGLIDYTAAGRASVAPSKNSRTCYLGLCAMYRQEENKKTICVFECLHRSLTATHPNSTPLAAQSRKIQIANTPPG